MDKKTLIEIHKTTKSEFLNEIANLLDNKLENLNKQYIKTKDTKLLNRKMCGVFFGVSTVTIDDWTKKGIIKAYRIGNRKIYKLHELEQALTKINQ